MRPFYPGGDYENYDYPDNCVVVDNPPFSIFSKICRFYASHNIPFFLFAPHSTLLSTKNMQWTGIVCGARIVYENGAKINTDFVSNLFGDIRIMTSPELCSRIAVAVTACKQSIKLPKYVYPDNVVSSALLGKIAPYVKFEVRTAECRQISKLDNQKGVSIFGGGFLLSHNATARKVEAERLVSKRQRETKQREAERWELSEREKQIIEELE